MNRVDRLVATILLLQSRKVVRARDIADHFEISIRTVYRDVRALCEAGVPVAAEAGEGYSLVEGYHLPPVMFTQEEASALFLGGKFVEQLTDASMVTNAESALLKIRAVLPDDTQEYLEKLQQSTALFFKGRPAGDGFNADVLATIQDAIVRQQVLALEYYSNYRDAFSQRDVEPLGLIFYANHWHLIAFCRMRQDYRDFRTDRIKVLKTRDERFATREELSFKDYLKELGKQENLHEIRVKFDARIAGSVREKYSWGLVEEKAGRDGVIMTFLVPDDPWIVHWLLSYGALLTVISPESLRQDLLAEAEKLVRHHQT